MAPQPPEKTAEQIAAERTQIRQENADAIVGSAEDALTGAGETLPPRQRSDDPGDDDGGLTRREPIQRSPNDDIRNQIAARFRRAEPEDERPFNGDLNAPENLYGDVADEDDDHDRELERAAPAVLPDDGNQRSRHPQKDQQPQKRTLKVRGRDVELTDDEILEAAQKTLAGDSYLEETRRLLEEAKNIRAERAGPTRQHPDGNSTQVELDAPDPNAAQHPEPSVVDLVRNIQFGEPEEVAAELERLIDSRADKASKKSVLQRTYDQDLARSQKALQAFTEANQDLANDEIAAMAIERGMYSLYREDILKLGIDETQLPKTPKELANWHRFYRMNGYEVRNTSDLLEKSKDNFLRWRNGGNAPATQQRQQTGPKAQARVQVNVNRDDRRMNIPVQPTRGVTPRRDAPPPQPRGSDVVAQMRKARGQV